jgi:hypothetical protein
MSNTDEFWRYAKEALLSAESAETDDERQSLLELAQTWLLAALSEPHPPEKPTAT